MDHALAVWLLCAAPVVPPPVDSRGPGLAVMQEHTALVRGTVLDYRRRPVAGALVSASGAGSLRTDDQGRFEIRVVRGAYLSASKSDMLGSVRVGDAAEQTVVIVMAQMPM